MNIHDFLKNNRTKSGFTQKRVADLLDVTIKTIDNWERDQIPSEIFYQQICEIYEISFDDFFDVLKETIKTKYFNNEDKTIVQYPFLNKKYNIKFTEKEQEIFIYLVENQDNPNLEILAAVRFNDYFEFLEKYKDILFAYHPIDQFGEIALFNHTGNIDDEEEGYESYCKDGKIIEIEIDGYENKLKPTNLGNLINDEIEKNYNFFHNYKLFNIQEMNKEFIFSYIDYILPEDTYNLNINIIKFWNKYNGIYNYPRFRMDEGCIEIINKDDEFAEHYLQYAEYTWEEVLKLNYNKYNDVSFITQEFLLDPLRSHELNYFYNFNDLEGKYFLNLFKALEFIKIEEDMDYNYTLEITKEFKMFLDFYESIYDKTE